MNSSDLKEDRSQHEGNDDRNKMPFTPEMTQLRWIPELLRAWTPERGYRCPYITSQLISGTPESGKINVVLTLPL